MKRVYFVRHGETDANRASLVQGLDETLSDTGRRQAAVIAARCRHLHFDAFYASDAVRARETAAAITAATGVSATLDPRFREVWRPSSFIGTPREAPAYQDFLAAELAHMDDPSWQVEDGEHFAAARARALDVLEFLEGDAAASILVVTHAHFLRYLVAAMLLERVLTPEVWRPLGIGFVASNTGLTLCEYNGERWRVVTWNDLAHFAE